MLKELSVVIAVAIVAAGGVYLFDPAKEPLEAAPRAKLEGSVYMLEKEFLVNLDDGRFATLQVGLVLAPEDTSTDSPNGDETFAPIRPAGYGAMLQEGLVRGVITDTLTGADDRDLATAKGRKRLKAAVLKQIQRHTDVQAQQVVLADLVIG